MESQEPRINDGEKKFGKMMIKSCEQKESAVSFDKSHFGRRPAGEMYCRRNSRRVEGQADMTGNLGKEKRGV